MKSILFDASKAMWFRVSDTSALASSHLSEYNNIKFDEVEKYFSALHFLANSMEIFQHVLKLIKSVLFTNPLVIASGNRNVSYTQREQNFLKRWLRHFSVFSFHVVIHYFVQGIQKVLESKESLFSFWRKHRKNFGQQLWITSVNKRCINQQQTLKKAKRKRQWKSVE